METEIKVMVGIGYDEASGRPDADELFVEQIYWPMPVEGFAGGMLEVNSKEELESWAKRKFPDGEYAFVSVKVDPDQPLPW